jgi:hypothetical protein
VDVSRGLLSLGCSAYDVSPFDPRKIVAYRSADDASRSSEDTGRRSTIVAKSIASKRVLTIPSCICVLANSLAWIGVG